MQSVDQPALVPVPFADTGVKRAIPIASQIGITDGAASYTDGFPPKTFLPLAVGGIPPAGADFNGILFLITEIQRWQSAGGLFKFDASFVTTIGGYPKGARLLNAAGTDVWINTSEDNITDPDGGSPAGWTSYSGIAGALLIGADDGASGSIFTTVAGFIAKILSADGDSIVGTIEPGTGAVYRTLQATQRDFPPNCRGYGAVGDGIADDTAAIQRALDTGACEVYLPPGRYKTTATLFLRQDQTLRGPRRNNNNNFVTTKMATIVFTPAVADTAITNAVGTTNNGTEDIQIHGTRNDSFGVGFLSSYSNKCKRVGFAGTLDVGLYAHDTYVCDFDELSFTGASVKHNCVYVGTTNATKISRVHTSTLPNDATVCMVGIALRSGKNSSIRDCILQGPTVGIHLYGPYGTVIENPYFENTVCNIKGDSVATAYSTIIIGGTYSKPYAGHPQYASRGPMVYSGNLQGVSMNQPNFLDSNVTDANVWPILMGSGGGGEWTISGAKYTGTSGGSRAQIFRELSGVSPSLSVMGEPYGTNGAVEIILKDDGAFGGLSYGIRVNNAGVLSTTAWTPPVIATAVPALIKTAFYIPVMP